jgi:hypothetical protein
MNDRQIATVQTTPRSPYQTFAEEDKASALVGDMLLFNKGLWTRGEDKRTVSADERFMCNLDEAYRGMVRWADGKPVEYLIGRIVDGFQMPLRDQLGHQDENKWETDKAGNVRDPWQPTYRLVMQDAKRELLTFVGGSWGARRGLQSLFGDFARANKGNGIWPVVSLGTEHRHHKTYGIVLEPQFCIVTWGMWNGQPRVEAPQIAQGGASLSQVLSDEIPFAAEWRA